MTADGDRYLRIIGIVLVVAFVVLAATAVLVAVTATENRVAPPEAEWRLDRVNATHARLTHETGESVAGTSLVVTVDGYERHVSWADRMTEDDSVVVRAARGQRVRLYWDGGRTDRLRLAHWQAATARPTTE